MDHKVDEEKLKRIKGKLKNFDKRKMFAECDNEDKSPLMRVGKVKVKI